VGRLAAALKADSAAISSILRSAPGGRGLFFFEKKNQKTFAI
jgi:hypothetical protein